MFERRSRFSDSVEEDAMTARREICYAGLVISSMILLGSLSSPLEVRMKQPKGAGLDEITRKTVESFNDAFNRHDAEKLATLLTDDTVFEDTSPAPDGRRVEGKNAVVELWRGWFARNADAHFDTEEMIVSGNRATVLWIYRKMRNGQPWHLRGVDVFMVRDGKIAAKLAYVKG